MLRNYSQAPHFTLLDESGIARSLEDIRGGAPLVVLFFRFAYCPTAQRDLMAWANVYDRVTALGAGLAAISADTVDNHLALRGRLQLPFPLLSDPDMAVSDTYGVYRSDETNEGPQPHGEPALYILDADGRVAFGQMQTGPRGSASPAESVLILLYMSQHGGRY